MSKLRFLRQKITLGFIRWSDFNRNPLRDFDAGFLKSLKFPGVVGHETDSTDAEVTQDIHANRVVAMIGFESELMIRGDGVVLSSILEFIRHELVHQADPPALLQLIYKDAVSALPDRFLSHRQLRAAIASAGPEHIARQTLGVNPHERCLACFRFAFYESHGTVGLVGQLEDVDPEVAEFCVESGLGNLDGVHRRKL